jgi:hypothetical protein
MKISYVAVLDHGKNLGILKKIQGFVRSLKSQGFDINMVTIDSSDDVIPRVIRTMESLDSDIIILRSLSYRNFYLINTFNKIRKRGAKILIDVPTPNRNSIRELYFSNNPLITRIRAIAYLIAIGPLPYFFVDRVFQYAEEGRWFMWGNKNKTILLGNGIDVESVPFLQEVGDFNGSQLKLIVVATTNYWHGVDRLIKAIALFNSRNKNRIVYLDIVGDGPSLEDLKLVVKKYLQSDYIHFHGLISGEDLHSIYRKAHVGVGSLGLHRIGLKSASILKLREYASAGLPFIYSGFDPDFVGDVPFAFQVSSTEDTEDLCLTFEKLFEVYPDIDRKDIRAFADANLDFKVKANKMLGGL